MELSTLKRLTRSTERYLTEEDGTYPEIQRMILNMTRYHPGHSPRWYIIAAINELGPNL